MTLHRILMHRIKLTPISFALSLVWLVITGSTPAEAQAAQTLPAAASAAVIADEPPAVRKMLLQASALEQSIKVADGPWQAAVLYCEASRLGSIEGQYRLGVLYAFGIGVPRDRPLAAALFSQAAWQGHLEAGNMLDTIQLSSAEMPTCVMQATLPEKAPTPYLAGLPADIMPGETPAIDRFLQSLPAQKRWVIPLATSLSAWYSLDPRLVLSVIAVESNFQTGAQSPKAAMGLMQLIPDTAERFNVRNAYNATQNMRGGMAYLRWLLAYYRGNIPYALAAYNAGEGRVDRYKGIPPFPETQGYVRRVMGLYGRSSHEFDEKVTGASAWLRDKVP